MDSQTTDRLRRAAVPQQTFLEKLFLLHEEFAKPQADIRVDRMSRHIYDLCKMADTPIADHAGIHGL